MFILVNVQLIECAQQGDPPASSRRPTSSELHTRDDSVLKEGASMCGNEGEILPPCYTPNQTFTIDTSFQNHYMQLDSAPCPCQTPYLWARALQRVTCSLSSMVRRRCDEVLVAFLELTDDLQRAVKQYSTGNNSCHTDPFEHVENTIYITSLSLRHGPIQFDVACRTHRLL